MSVLTVQKELDDKKNGVGLKPGETKLSPDKIFGTYEVSKYEMSPEAHKVRSMILLQFALGDLTMQKPRVEFNDISVIGRQQIDQMSFNTYQPNNGDATDGLDLDAWKSRAIRPVVRNKCISIAAHATARVIFPKVFARDSQSEAQEDAARVMESLMEYAADCSNFPQYSLMRTIQALTDPASIGYQEYCEVYRTVKRPKETGGYESVQEIDKTLSGFQNISVPVNELYIENFYEPDIQKQGWLIWRKVISYSLAEAKYKHYPNFQYVKPGVQLIYNDANISFYQVYDTNMRQWDAEEIIYWNRSLDLKIIMVNGVMLTEHDNPNPRNDKLYPFDKFGYEPINTRCFYYKSLAFKMQPDANVINTLYPMIIDGTYLNIMPPMINIGPDKIGSDVVVPGVITTLSTGSQMQPLQTSNNLKAGLDALMKTEESINEASQEPLLQGDKNVGDTTAYQISRMEANANTVLGLFIQMRADHIKQFGTLRQGDILQYLTIADADTITDNVGLIYKTFLLQNKETNGQTKHRQIKFSDQMPDEPQTDDQKLEMSYGVLEKQGGEDSDKELYEVNPKLFRELEYMTVTSPDIMNPRSSDLERAFKLEIYDRGIQNKAIDQEALTKDFLLGAYDFARKDPDKYIAKQPQQMPAMAGAMEGTNPQSPIDALSGQFNQPNFKI